MTGRILILNTSVSGMNTYLFSQLKKRGWELSIVNVPFPKICMLLAMCSSFTPNIFLFPQKYNEKIGSLNKYPWTFIQKTKFCQKNLKKLAGEYDLIFEISGMFSPSLKYNKINVPYVTFNSYTMALSKKYPKWIPPSFQIQRWMQLEKELYDNAKFIFATNENVRKSFIDDYNINPEKVIPVRYGVLLDDIPKFSRTYNNKIILFIGKEFERKGGFILLKAFEKVKRVIKDARLIIIGPSRDSLKIEQPGVQVLGLIQDKNKIKEFYKCASIFVMPSFCEPFGLVFLEAMAYKLPCIGTTVDAMPEIIEDGKTGFLITSEDVNALAEKIIVLLEDDDLLQRMGEAGYKRLNHLFQWDELGGKIDFFIKQCI